MVFKKKIIIARTVLFASIALFSQNTYALKTSILSANALVRPQAIERLIREAIANALKGSIDGNALNFDMKAVNESVELPTPKGELVNIFKALGISDSIGVNLSPIEANFTLPPSQLQLTVKNIEENIFSIKAQWKISRIHAKSQKLSMVIPKGFFDQSLQIDSSPIEIGLEPNSKPILLSLELNAMFSEAGTKLDFKKFTTNLNALDGPQIFANLGKLTVNGAPLELEIISNGTVLHAYEPAIREQLKQIEPSLIKSIKSRLTTMIQTEFIKISEKIENDKPFKFSIKINSFLEKLDPHSAVVQLFHDITLDLNFSYLQFIEKTKLFNAQISSYICFEDQCLYNNGSTSEITSEDIRTLKKDEGVGILVYESWIQNIFHSEKFQSRIKNFYRDSSKSPGTTLAPEGIKVHFSPEMNALVLVMNINIDIRKTAQFNRDFGAWLERQIGAGWEYFRGTGRMVKVPIEIVTKLDGIEKDEEGKLNLKLTPDFPLLTKGEVQNTYQYPNNTDKLTSLVKQKLLNTVKTEVSSLLQKLLSNQKQLKVPLESLTQVEGYSFTPKRVFITPNRGLLITAGVSE